MKLRTVPVTLRVVYAAIVAAALAVGTAAGHTSATSDDRPVARALTAVGNSLTVNGTVRINGTDSGDALTIKTGVVGQRHGLLVVDKDNAPIFVVPGYGGPATLGDNYREFHPGAIFAGHSLILRYDGSITLGQQVGSDANPVQQGGVTLYSGAADPNIQPPAHEQTDAHGAVVTRPFYNGDRYFRANGDTLVYLDGTWVVK